MGAREPRPPSSRRRPRSSPRASRSDRRRGHWSASSPRLRETPCSGWPRRRWGATWWREARRSSTSRTVRCRSRTGPRATSSCLARAPSTSTRRSRSGIGCWSRWTCQWCWSRPATAPRSTGWRSSRPRACRPAISGSAPGPGSTGATGMRSRLVPAATSGRPPRLRSPMRATARCGASRRSSSAAGCGTSCGAPPWAPSCARPPTPAPSRPARAPRWCSGKSSSSSGRSSP